MRLEDIASVVRSKNAGPFITTLDVFFETDSAYELATSSDAFAPDRIAKLYQLEPSNLLGIYFLKDARGIKISFVKPGYASGDPGYVDVYSCQQHVPLLGLEFEDGLGTN